VDDCPSCAGSGTIWVELDNPSGVSKDPSELSQFFFDSQNTQMYRVTCTLPRAMSDCFSNLDA